MVKRLRGRLLPAIAASACVVAFALDGCMKDNVTAPQATAPAGDPNLSASLSLMGSGMPGKMANAEFNQVNLVSDVTGFSAARTDANLVNAWGIAVTGNGDIWVAENGPGTAELLDKRGNAKGQPISIPGVGMPTGGTPSGVILNTTDDFFIPGSRMRSRVIFVTEDGIIAAWSSGSAAVTVVDRSEGGTAYKGVAIAQVGRSHWLYATDFHDARVHVFNAKFGFVTDTLFNDPTIPAGYAPFNIANMGGKLIVTFAAQKPPDNHDDQAGAGFGFVDVFTARGEFVRRLASGGTLNAPWGLARAGDNMGMFSDALLVSNFGDGKINAFDAAGNFLGQLPDTSGNPLSIDGLWGIASVNAESDHGESRAALYFAAGPNEEGDGLFGFLAPVKSRGGFHAHR